MTNLSPSLGLVPLVPGPVQTIEICESLRVGDFDRGFEMCASDRDFGYFRFCEHPDRDCQREEGNRNTKFSHHCPPPVPPALALEAIDKVLDATKEQVPQPQYTVSSANGIVVLKSNYDLRLFQILPVLEELDKQKAYAETFAEMLQLTQTAGGQISGVLSPDPESPMPMSQTCCT